ncbi:MAG: NAD-dependent epimerase/dehydratase family protein [Chloroflexi bacterium]|nr:NAD-dependent epimerase/dehydratase family protein [Chloroflexota bacterium]
MTVLVVGGNGALGSAILRRLRGLGAAVRSFDLSPHPDAGVESRVGDVRQMEEVMAACDGVEAVIHTAVKVSQQATPSQSMYEVNVRGTENLIAACQAQRVSRLIYTSSVDVVFDGTPIANGDERLPYPKAHLDYYGTTKMLAEQAVLAANGAAGVATCALRVGGLFGPGDRHRFPRVLQIVLDSGMYTRIGDGKSRFNHLFIENAAHAHVLAAERLALDSPLAAQAYFITDQAPGNFFDLFPPYLDALGVRYKVRTLPYTLMRMVADLNERRSRRAAAGEDREISLSRYAVESTCRDFWFTSKKAARELGYAPIVSAEEAFAATLDWLRGWMAARQAEGQESH